MIELAKALLAARQDMPATVFKKGQIKAEGNERAPKYNYAGHEHVLLHVREKMLAHGLVLVQTCVEFAGYAEWETRDGIKRILRWKGTHKLMHVSGESLEYTCEATTNTNDKSAFVASTACDRTALLRLMQLAGSADEDPEHHTNQQKEERSTPRDRAPRNTEKGRPSAHTSRGAQTEGGSATLDPSWQPPSFGVQLPEGPCPTFSANAKPEHANKPWSEGVWIVEGWLRDPGTRERMSSKHLAWAERLSEQRRRRKLWEAAQAKAAKSATPDINSPDYLAREAEEAERALNAQGAGNASR